MVANEPMSQDEMDAYEVAASQIADASACAQDQEEISEPLRDYLYDLAKVLDRHGRDTAILRWLISYIDGAH